MADDHDDAVVGSFTEGVERERVGWERKGKGKGEQERERGEGARERRAETITQCLLHLIEGVGARQP